MTVLELPGGDIPYFALASVFIDACAIYEKKTLLGEQINEGLFFVEEI